MAKSFFARPESLGRADAVMLGVALPAKGSDASQRRNGRERRRRRRHLTDHLLVFGEGAPGSYQAQPTSQPHLLYAYPPGVPLPPSIATFCFPGGALPPAAQGSPIFSCNVVSSATRRVAHLGGKARPKGRPARNRSASRPRPQAALS